MPPMDRVAQPASILLPDFFLFLFQNQTLSVQTGVWPRPRDCIAQSSPPSKLSIRRMYGLSSFECRVGLYSRNCGPNAFKAPCRNSAMLEARTESPNAQTLQFIGEGSPSRNDRLTGSLVSRQMVAILFESITPAANSEKAAIGR